MVVGQLKINWLKVLQDYENSLKIEYSLGTKENDSEIKKILKQHKQQCKYLRKICKLEDKIINGGDKSCLNFLF